MLARDHLDQKTKSYPFDYAIMKSLMILVKAVS